MSGHATGPKDLLRHLKTAFGSTEAVFATCSPPAELITLVDEYLSAKRDPEETSKLLLGLADLTESVASARYQGLDQGKCSAWLDLIAPLCLSATTSSARLESSTALWDRLLKPIFIPGKTSGPVLSRSALVAAKELALWCLASREDFSSSSKLSSAEDTLLTAYLDGSARAADVSRLEDLLLAIGKHSKALLPTLKIRLSTRPTDRAAILDLLLALVRHHSNIVHTLIPAGVFEDVLLCILVEVDPSVLHLSSKLLLAVLPYILGGVQPFLADLLACYAKLACVEQNAPSHIVLQDTWTTTSVPSYRPVPVPSLLEHIRWTQGAFTADVDYCRLDTSRFFDYLYGLAPCCLMQFLKSPTALLQDMEWQSPYSAGFKERTLGLDAISGFSESLLRTHVIQPAVLFGEWRSEAQAIARTWSKSDAAAFIAHCETLVAYVANTLVTSDEVAEENELERAPSRSASIQSATRAKSPRPASRSSSLIQHSKSLPPNLDFLSTFVNFDRATAPSRANSLNAVAAIKDASHRSEALYGWAVHQDRSIARLTADLRFEQHLRSQHQQTLGLLHRQRTLESGFEAERQTLYQALKHLRSTLLDRQAQLDRQRTEASSARTSHTQWAAELRQRVKVLKEENRTLRQANDEMSAQQALSKEQTSHQAEQLEELGSTVFDLSGQIAADKSKLERLAELEESLSRMTTAMFLWNQDAARHRAKEEEVENLLSDVRKGEEARLAADKEIARLSAELRRIDEQLITALSDSRTGCKAEAAAPPDFPRSLSDSSYDQLREAYDTLRNQHRLLLEATAEAKTGPPLVNGVNGGSLASNS